MKVVVGIVSKNITIEEFFNWSWQRINDRVRYALAKNGARVLGVLPQTTRKDFNRADESENVELGEEEKQDLISVLKLCDGIILQGGISSHNYEEFVARYCYENDIPLLGICAGFNNIIRGLGGSTTKTDKTDYHDRPDLEYAHKCKIVDKDSLFYKIVGKEVFDVNSVHTYIAKEVPTKLSVVALSDDGQVEVVEAKDKSFCMGIKYHPELLVDKDDIQNAIFEKFIQCCEQKKNKN